MDDQLKNPEIREKLEFKAQSSDTDELEEEEKLPF